jgi:hypothetical protein
MTRVLVVYIAAMVVLASVEPALVKLAHAAAPIVLALCVVFVLARAAWFFTRRW